MPPGDVLDSYAVARRNSLKPSTTQPFIHPFIRPSIHSTNIDGQRYNVLLLSSNARSTSEAPVANCSKRQCEACWYAAVLYDHQLHRFTAYTPAEELFLRTVGHRSERGRSKASSGPSRRSVIL